MRNNRYPELIFSVCGSEHNNLLESRVELPLFSPSEPPTESLMPTAGAYITPELGLTDSFRASVLSTSYCFPPGSLPTLRINPYSLAQHNTVPLSCLRFHICDFSCVMSLANGV